VTDGVTGTADLASSAVTDEVTGTAAGSSSIS